VSYLQAFNLTVVNTGREQDIVGHRSKMCTYALPLHHGHVIPTRYCTLRAIYTATYNTKKDAAHILLMPRSVLLHLFTCLRLHDGLYPLVDRHRCAFEDK
jgi:hypothetical protein